MQRKLANSFPNFNKIRDEDDYEQFITFMTHEPLYESFLLSFTQYLASEFNQGRIQSEQVKAPKEINLKALLNFFHAISYDLCLQTPNKELLKKNTLYVELFENQLKYTVIDPAGKEINGVIHFSELYFALDNTLSEEDLKNTYRLFCKLLHNEDILEIFLFIKLHR